MIIEKALVMEQSEIEKLRKNVLDYYNDYLSLDIITKKIASFSKTSQHKLNVAIPFIPTKQEWRAQIALYNPLFLKQIGLRHLHQGNAVKQ